MSVPEAEIAVRVNVLLFSVLREEVGESTLSLDVPSGCTGGALLDQLAADYPAIHRFREHTRLAVNASYVAEDVVLQDGDEVALITPTSGG
jgi:molybdopterin converting factor subunit 1